MLCAPKRGANAKGLDRNRRLPRVDMRYFIAEKFRCLMGMQVGEVMGEVLIEDGRRDAFGQAGRAIADTRDVAADISVTDGGGERKIVDRLQRRNNLPRLGLKLKGGSQDRKIKKLR